MEAGAGDRDCCRSHGARGVRGGSTRHWHVSDQVWGYISILHLGIVCQEPDMPGINIATTTPDDPTLLAGDHITLLIETASNSYYEIAINYQTDLAFPHRGVRACPRSRPSSK